MKLWRTRPPSERYQDVDDFTLVQAVVGEEAGA